MLEEIPSVNVFGANLYIIAKKDIVSPFWHDLVLQFFYWRFCHGRGGIRESASPGYLVN